MTTHELKVWPSYYEAIVRGEKRFEARQDDRGFQVGDVLLLREWDPSSGGTHSPSSPAYELPAGYTGRSSRWCVTYLLRGPGFGVEAGHVVMSIAPEVAT